MSDHDNPGNPEMVSGDDLLRFLQKDLTIERPQPIQINIPTIEMPVLMSRTTWHVLMVCAGIVVGATAFSLGVPPVISLGAMGAIGVVLGATAKKRRWIP